ncbi:unnamed protein product [Victoria cruziana]
MGFRNHVISWFDVLDGLLGKHGGTQVYTFLLFVMVENSNIQHLNDHRDKRTWTYTVGACCATVFMAPFHNYRMWSFIRLPMTIYTA